jgi:uncharacterized membrane protein
VSTVPEPSGGADRSLWTRFIDRWRRAKPASATLELAKRIGAPRLILAWVMLTWFLIFAVLVFMRHDRFGSFGFDLGIFDQSIWLHSRGAGFNTVRGMQTLGHHGSIGFFLLVPFYWLGAGPHFLNLFQVAVVVLGGIPVFMAAKRVLGNEWHALIPALAFVVNAVLQWHFQELFHPEVVAITPFLCAYVAYQRQRWLPYALFLALAISWKEDVAVAALMLGFLLLWRGHRKAGVFTMLGAAAWFVFVTQALIPIFNPEGTFYGQFFGELGDTPVKVIASAFTNPGLFLRRLWEGVPIIKYLFFLAAPYGLLSFLSPGALLIGLPQIFINLLSVNSFTEEFRFHYAAIPVLAFTIAMIEGLGRVRPMPARRFCLGTVAAFGVCAVIVMGISPLSIHYHEGYWPLQDNPRQEIMEQAVSLPGPGDTVTATYRFVPHFTHRHEIFEFPNPWRPFNWGVHDENQRSPESVDWLVADMYSIGEGDQALVEEIVAGEEWEVVLDEGGIVVAHRE